MKPTKKEIQRVLRTLDVTAIHRIAHLIGVPVMSKTAMFHFIRNNAPSKKLVKMAYRLSHGRSEYNVLKKQSKPLNQPIYSAIWFAKFQVSEKFQIKYTKVLVQDGEDYYWCSPIYGLDDYNRRVAFERSARHDKIAETINNYLYKNLINKP